MIQLHSNSFFLSITYLISIPFLLPTSQTASHWVKCLPSLQPLFSQITSLSLSMPNSLTSIYWMSSKPDVCLVLSHANVSKGSFEALSSLLHSLSRFKPNNLVLQTNSVYADTCRKATGTTRQSILISIRNNSRLVLIPRLESPMW